ncbi:MAG: hypothetical protein GY906_05005 [bacterium]|nr:hypothetical protein [bacterium]
MSVQSVAIPTPVGGVGVRRLLGLGGVLSIAAAAFHVLLARAIYLSAELDEATRALLQALNVVGILMIGFVGIAAFLYRAELLTTRLGRGVLVLTVLMWGSRAIEEIVLFEGSPVMLGYCLITTVAFAVPWFASRRSG